jgi:hypothetical protein
METIEKLQRYRYMEFVESWRDFDRLEPPEN